MPRLWENPWDSEYQITELKDRSGCEIDWVGLRLSSHSGYAILGSWRSWVCHTCHSKFSVSVWQQKFMLCKNHGSYVNFHVCCARSTYHHIQRGWCKMYTVYTHTQIYSHIHKINPCMCIHATVKKSKPAYYGKRECLGKMACSMKQNHETKSTCFLQI